MSVCDRILVSVPLLVSLPQDLTWGHEAGPALAELVTGYACVPNIPNILYTVDHS